MQNERKAALAAQTKLVSAAAKFVDGVTAAGEIDEMAAEIVAAAALAAPRWPDVASLSRLGEALASRGAIAEAQSRAGGGDIAFGLRMRYVDCLYAHDFWPLERIRAKSTPGIFPAELAFNVAAAIAAGVPERIERMLAIAGRYRDHGLFATLWPDTDQAPLAFYLADSARAGRLVAADGLTAPYRDCVGTLASGGLREAAEAFLTWRAVEAAKHVRNDDGAYSGHAYSLLPVDFIALARLAGFGPDAVDAAFAPLLTPAMFAPDAAPAGPLAAAVAALEARLPASAGDWGGG